MPGLRFILRGILGNPLLEDGNEKLFAVIFIIIN